MGEIREPWASGFGYGGLAKKFYTARLRATTTQEDAMDQEKMESPLVEGLAAIGSSLDEHGGRIRELEQRLQPVLRPTEPRPARPQTGEEAQSRSPTELRLRDLLDELCAHTTAVEDILSRLRA